MLRFRTSRGIASFARLDPTSDSELGGPAEKALIARGVRNRTFCRRDTLAVTGRAHAPAMIYIECAWCETEVAVDGLDATSVECADCNVIVELAQDDHTTISIAA